MSQPLRVLYIAGTGRSGSTLVSRVLGASPGVFAAGEVRFLLERGLLADRRCGCGEAFSACPVWSSIMAELPPDLDAVSLLAESRRVLRVRRLPRLLADLDDPDGVLRRVAAYSAHLVDVYRAVAHSTGASVIVDSSKLPSYGWLVAQQPELDVRVVHLVRDPRATAFSWTRSKPTGDGVADMHQLSSVRSAALWRIWNGAAIRMWDDDACMRVRYEDYVSSPRTWTQRIAAFAGITVDESSFLDERTVALPDNHLVAGNPDRLAGRGVVTITMDGEWAGALPLGRQRVVQALTAPVRERLGYEHDVAAPLTVG